MGLPLTETKPSLLKHGNPCQNISSFGLRTSALKASNVDLAVGVFPIARGAYRFPKQKKKQLVLSGVSTTRSKKSVSRDGDNEGAEEGNVDGNAAWEDELEPTNFVLDLQETPTKMGTDGFNFEEELEKEERDWQLNLVIGDFGCARSDEENSSYDRILNIVQSSDEETDDVVSSIEGSIDRDPLEDEGFCLGEF
ncbi:hypothetical protein M0R45_036540 [Rubus argutus]|uniref:Uncharacterized protein n=1 Tax=Rubus argutus TaxID=59490 RepID=A0AAW1VXV7_RUBAR